MTSNKTLSNTMIPRDTALFITSFLLLTDMSLKHRFFTVQTNLNGTGCIWYNISLNDVIKYYDYTLNA